jgi:hypothetical protein
MERLLPTMVVGRHRVAQKLRARSRIRIQDVGPAVRAGEARRGPRETRRRGDVLEPLYHGVDRGAEEDAPAATAED